VKNSEEAFENAKVFPNNLKVMKTESFRFVGNKSNIEEIPQHKEKSVQSEEIPRACYVDEKSRGYKSWDELTQMDKAIFKLIGGKIINCYWDYKRSPDNPMTPVVREVKDQKERNENDKITYVVGPKWINIWYLAKGENHSEIKEMNALTDDVKELCKRINL
jgi:hypothetical protein